MGADILQLLLLGNVFVLGIVVTIAIRHFTEHRDARHHTPSIISEDMHTELSEATKQQFMAVLESSGAALTNEMNTTAKRLNRLLEQFGTDILEDEMRLFRQNLEIIRKKIESETASSHNQIADHQTEIETELQRRRDEIARRFNDHQARLEASLLEAQSSMQQTLVERQQRFTQSLAQRETALDANLDAQLQKERQLLVDQIDTRLGDAVASFLTNSLGSNIDLGAQTPYLMQLLDSHKDEIKREVMPDGHNNPTK